MFFLGPFIPLKTRGVWKPRVINLSIGKHILTYIDYVFTGSHFFRLRSLCFFHFLLGFLKPPHPTSTEIAKKKHYGTATGITNFAMDYLAAKHIPYSHVGKYTIH